MSNAKNTIIRTFEYKIRPNKKFISACERELEHSRQIYNAALAERISCYRITGKTLGWIEQKRHLTEARTIPEIGAHYRRIQVDALERVDSAFQVYFRRLSEGEGKPGFPRFKGRHRYHTFSLEYPQSRKFPLCGDKLDVPGVGTCRVRLSRPIEGKVKVIRITRRCDGWYALLVCEIEKSAPLPITGQKVSVNVGATSYATFSNGEEVNIPDQMKEAQRRMARRRRQFQRKTRGSQNKSKSQVRLAKSHLKIKRIRRDFHHKLSTDLVRRFDSISVEKHEILKLVKTHKIAQAIYDDGWANLFTMIQVKAESAGRVFEKTSPMHSCLSIRSCRHWQ